MRSIESAKDLSTIADEQQSFIFVLAFAAECSSLFKFRRTLRLQSGVIPVVSHCRHVPPSRKFVANDRSLRISFVVAVGRAGFNRRWRFKLQHAEKCVVAVRSHI